MRERDLFRMMVRLVAVVFLAMGLADLISAALSLTGGPDAVGGAGWFRVLAAVSYLLTGAVVLAAAQPLTRLIYGRDRPW